MHMPTMTHAENPRPADLTELGINIWARTLAHGSMADEPEMLALYDAALAFIADENIAEDVFTHMVEALATALPAGLVRIPLTDDQLVGVALQLPTTAAGVDETRIPVVMQYARQLNAGHRPNPSSPVDDEWLHAAALTAGMWIAAIQNDDETDVDAIDEAFEHAMRRFGRGQGVDTNPAIGA